MLTLALSGWASAGAAGWPSAYGGVMLQGFYWDSYSASQWEKLDSQADELAQYFSLIWIPQSGNANTGSNNMGYMPYYYWDQDSSFGTEEQLRSMISTFKALGLGTIADVVVNHHNTTGWFEFPEETYNGVTYQFQSTDICSDDDGGATKTEADAEGVSLSSNKDEGEDWSGCRDLDHQSDNVQTIIKAYVKYLKDDLGYTGFRYDMVKGFDGSHVKDYNVEAGVEYSVGEYWDSNTKIENWIKATDYNSAAFDFQFRYNIRDAINNSDWSELYSTNNLMHDDTYKQYAVTFVENHDTEYRSSSEQQDPIKKDTLAANAYMLAMPGTPCVFMRHWIDCKQEIKGMIDARKAIGITNTSSYNSFGSTSNSSYYSVNVTGTNGNLLCVVGSGSPTISSSTWTNVVSGYHYAYYFKNSNEMVWADKASGEYDSAFNVLLSLVSATTGTKIVYTKDGTTPTASNGTQLSESSEITISEPTTLKVGLLNGSTVSKVITREYTFSGEFEEYDITVYVNADDAGSKWSAAYSTASSPYINYWFWNDDNSYHTPENSSWPGDKVTETATVDGKTWFKKDFTIYSSDDYVSFVFSVGTGSPQTVDVSNVSSTKFYEISSETSSSKYKVNDVTSTYTDGITAIAAEPRSNTAVKGIYTIDGRKVSDNSDTSTLTKGVYISNGKKIVVR